MADSPIFIHDPDGRSFYTFDWTPWLVDRGQTIASRVTTIGAGLTRYGSDVTTSYTTTVGIINGKVGREYKIVDTITTTPSGMIEPRTIIIKVRNK